MPSRAIAGFTVAGQDRVERHERRDVVEIAVIPLELRERPRRDVGQRRDLIDPLDQGLDVVHVAGRFGRGLAFLDSRLPVGRMALRGHSRGTCSHTLQNFSVPS
jgi:hypothetical protein